MRRALPVTWAAFIGTLFIAAAVPAQADEWGNQSSETGAHPDEGPHTFCFTASVGNGLRQQIEYAEYQSLEGPTDANVTYHSSCTMTGTSETDVVWYEAS